MSDVGQSPLRPKETKIIHAMIRPLPPHAPP
jgi:hypothetical protein